MSLIIGLARLAAFAALPLGWFADRHGRRRPFLIGVALVLAGGTLAGTAMAAWQFGLFHAVLRTGPAAMAGLGVVILAETVSPSVRPPAGRWWWGCPAHVAARRECRGPSAPRLDPSGPGDDRGAPGRGPVVRPGPWRVGCSLLEGGERRVPRLGVRDVRDVLHHRAP